MTEYNGSDDGGVPNAGFSSNSLQHPISRMMGPNGGRTWRPLSNSGSGSDAGDTLQRKAAANQQWDWKEIS